MLGKGVRSVGGVVQHSIVVKTPAQWKPLLNYLHCVHSALYTALIICLWLIWIARHLCWMLLSAW